MTRALPGLVLLATALAYLPSLGGGWIWDDHSLLAANEALSSLSRLWTEDVWGPTGTPSDLYRPLVMTSHAAVQAVWPGPLSARLANLGLHLLAVAALAAGGARTGLPRPVSWMAAAIFGLHPAASEAVAWVTGRHDLLPAVLVLAGWSLFVGERRWLAGALLALTPLCKESYLLAPLIGAAWCLGARRAHAGPLLLPLLGVAAVLGLRWAVALPMPVGAAASQPVAALGGLLYRGALITAVPSAVDITAPYVGRLALGCIALALGLVAWVLAWGRPRVAGLAGALVILLPAAPAAAQIGLIADRYFYLPLAFLSLVGVGAAAAAPWHRALWAVPAGLAPLLMLRAVTWTSDAQVFGASLARDPANPHAAFHVAYDLHQRAGDCAAAEPLYRQAVAVEPRAGRNLQACLLEQGRLAEAAEMGPALWDAAPGHAGVAANTARALGGLGQPEAALAWAARAVSAAPQRADLWVLQGNLHGMAGALDEAEASFTEALARQPADPAALEGLQAVQRARSAQ